MLIGISCYSRVFGQHSNDDQHITLSRPINVLLRTPTRSVHCYLQDSCKVPLMKPFKPQMRRGCGYRVVEETLCTSHDICVL